MKQRTSKMYCSICKFKIRGADHKEGEHHQKAVEKLEKLENKK